MSEAPSRATVLASLAAAVAAGTVYVLVHESRRKRKKAEKVARDAPISKELLLKILNKSAEESKAVIEKIRVEVQKIQQQRNLSAQQAHQLFQQNFEHSLDQLIGLIRNGQKVSEKAMDSSFKQHQNDPAVRAAIQNMRVMSQDPATPATVAAPAAAAGSTTELPASLTRDKLREIMTFNAVTLEKELKPIREQMEQIRRQGQQPQVAPHVLQAVQRKISDAVTAKYGVTDEQVMAAIDHYGAREDPAFQSILQRIAKAFQESLA